MGTYQESTGGPLRPSRLGRILQGIWKERHIPTECMCFGVLSRGLAWLYHTTHTFPRRPRHGQRYVCNHPVSRSGSSVGPISEKFLQSCLPYRKLLFECAMTRTTTGIPRPSFLTYSISFGRFKVKSLAGCAQALTMADRLLFALPLVTPCQRAA